MGAYHTLTRKALPRKSLDSIWGAFLPKRRAAKQLPFRLFTLGKGRRLPNPVHPTELPRPGLPARADIYQPYDNAPFQIRSPSLSRLLVWTRF